MQNLLTAVFRPTFPCRFSAKLLLCNKVIRQVQDLTLSLRSSCVYSMHSFMHFCVFSLANPSFINLMLQKPASDIKISKGSRKYVPFLRLLFHTHLAKRIISSFDLIGTLWSIIYLGYEEANLGGKWKRIMIQAHCKTGSATKIKFYLRSVLKNDNLIILPFALRTDTVCLFDYSAGMTQLTFFCVKESDASQIISPSTFLNTKLWQNIPLGIVKAACLASLLSSFHLISALHP